MSPWIGTGPHDRHLDDEIVEAARLQARQHVHLRAAFHLEHADRIGPAQHVVDGRIIARHVGQRHRQTVMLFQKLEGLADAGQHAERQHVDLQQTQRGDVVLVPFDEGAVVHGRVADGHDLDQRTARQDEAADVLR